MCPLARPVTARTTYEFRVWCATLRLDLQLIPRVLGEAFRGCHVWPVKEFLMAVVTCTCFEDRNWYVI